MKFWTYGRKRGKQNTERRGFRIRKRTFCFAKLETIGRSKKTNKQTKGTRERAFVPLPPTNEKRKFSSPVLAKSS